MTIILEDEVLTLTAVAVDLGKLCSGHRDVIPGGCAYEDQHGWLWCIACAKHMAECDDETCDHPRAVFASATAASPDLSQPHPFDLDPDVTGFEPEGGVCRCGWLMGDPLHQAGETAVA